MRYLYTIFLYLMMPFVILRLFWKSRRLSVYRERLGERFFIGCNNVEPVDVWVHAVSLGEVVAASPLIQAFLESGLRVMVTTMTPTGSQQVRSRFGDKVAHQYIPYDLPCALRRFFKTIKPCLGIIMETELWPNVIFQAQKAHCPLLLVNARLSDRAFKQYVMVSFIFKPILNQLTTILAQSEEDARRFMALGADAHRVQVIGNLKFDIRPSKMDESTHPLWSQFSKLLRNNSVIVMLASTHDDEELQILTRLARLKQAIPNALLLIAPRHPERFKRVYQLSQQQGFNTALRSQPTEITAETEVVVLDSMGELLLFYALSDYAFVGGSLVPIGGHNVLEPISVGVPVFCGPYMTNFKAIYSDLSKVSAIEGVLNADDLIEKIIALYQNPARRIQQIERATAVLKANQGALSRCLEHAAQFIG